MPRKNNNNIVDKQLQQACNPGCEDGYTTQRATHSSCAGSSLVLSCWPYWSDQPESWPKTQCTAGQRTVITFNVSV